MMINLLKRRFFFFFFLMFSVCSFAQTTEIQLWKQFRSAEKLSESNPQKSIEICKIVYQEALKNNNVILEIECLTTIAFNYDFLRDTKNAIAYGEKLKPIAKGVNDVAYLDAIRMEARVYSDMGIYDKSENILKEAIYYLDGQKKLKFLQAKGGLSEEEKFHALKGSIYYDLYNIFYLNKSSFDKELKYIDLAISEHFLIKKTNSKQNYYLSRDYAGKADSYLDRKQYQNALICLVDAEQYLNKDDDAMRANIEANKGIIYYNFKDYNKSIGYLLNAEKLDIDNPDVQVQIYEYLYLGYKELGDHKNSNNYFIKYTKVKNRLEQLNKNSTNQVVNSLINNENKNFDSTKSNLYLIISGISILLIIFFVIYIKNHKKSKKEFANYQKIIEKLQNQESLISLPLIINSTTEKTTFSVSSDKETEILKKLDKFEKSEGFKNKNLSLSSLAESLGTNTAYLSTVINANKNKNFNGYINELRINYIIHKLKNDPQYLKYKISHLAEECGFSSHNTFTIAFSNLAGVSPSNFVKFLTQEK